MFFTVMGIVEFIYTLKSKLKEHNTFFMIQPLMGYEDTTGFHYILKVFFFLLFLSARGISDCNFFLVALL